MYKKKLLFEYFDKKIILKFILVLFLLLGVYGINKDDERISLQIGENLLYSATIDSSNGYIYFGTYTFPGKIIKVRLVNFTRESAITLQPGPGKIIKVRLSDFTKEATLVLQPGEDLLYSATIDKDNGYAYFGVNTYPGKIIKIRLSNFTEESLLLDYSESISGQVRLQER